MVRVELTRYGDDGRATLGRIQVISRVGTIGTLLHTIERPWEHNLRKVSCIPEGTYQLVLGRYHKGGYPAYEVVSVPDRSFIKLHVANWAHEVMGCIGIGTSTGYSRAGLMVRDSWDGFKLFMNSMAEAGAEVHPGAILVVRYAGQP